MKILLIQPPMTLLLNEIRSVTFHLGLAYIAACLGKEGHNVSVIDCIALGQNSFIKKGNLLHFSLG